jgi:hypothetical protein
VNPDGEGSWNELERGFFEAAPPEVPAPPPPAARFDDLDSTAPPRPHRGRRPARSHRRPAVWLAAALLAVTGACAGAGAWWTRDRSAARAFKLGVGGGAALICQAAGLHAR